MLPVYKLVLGCACECLQRKREFGSRIVEYLQLVGPAFAVVCFDFLAERGSDYGIRIGIETKSNAHVAVVVGCETRIHTHSVELRHRASVRKNNGRNVLSALQIEETGLDGLRLVNMVIGFCPSSEHLA
ncbi:hypothetical protein, partial [Qipengyuania sp. YIM B01966]|uniref:hypothetical protein n=1 Tax=Qipengyuania sp. YIM B01966 TaxID=2778646 RepID=UPI001F2C5900